MTMGLSTLSIWMCWNVTFETLPGWEGLFVLILTPFWVPTKLEFVTLKPVIDLLEMLPRLIPWPGPQWIRVTEMFLESGRKARQSSPVAITESCIWMLLDSPILIPSVLGLSPGAVMWMLLNITSRHAKQLMWVFLLLRLVMFSIFVLLAKSNFNDWNQGKHNQLAYILTSISEYMCLFWSS